LRPLTGWSQTHTPSSRRRQGHLERRPRLLAVHPRNPQLASLLPRRAAGGREVRPRGDDAAEVPGPERGLVQQRRAVHDEGRRRRLRCEGVPLLDRPACHLEAGAEVGRQPLGGPVLVRLERVGGPGIVVAVQPHRPNRTV
jgi:hypothetical protein